MEKREGKVREKRAYEGPSMMVYDAKRRMNVAAYGDDRGTPETLRRVIDYLAEFVDDGVLPFPVRAQEVSVEGRIQYANRKKDGIDVLHERGAIGDIELIAARELQAAYDVWNDIRMSGISPECVRGSKPDVEYLVQRRIRAGDKVNEMLDLIGGVGCVPRLTVDAMVGRRLTLREMVIRHGRSKDYWSGCLSSGLQSLAHHVIKGMKGRRVDSVRTRM